MNFARVALTLMLPLGLASASPAWGLVFGGGPKRIDCSAAWQVTSRAVEPTKRKKGKPKGVGVDCQDGNSDCDVDGAVNGSCTVGVSICAFQTDPNNTRCTPQPVTLIDKITGKSMGAVKATLPVPPVPPPPTLPASTADCGTAAIVTIPASSKPKDKVLYKMRATAGKKDKDKLILRCLPSPPACATNPGGGPSQLLLTTVRAGDGGDLDNGWNGISHNFPIVGDSILSFCLDQCGGADTDCVGTGATGANTTNGATFGAPLPLLAAGAPVCVVNRFEGEIVARSANYATGAIDTGVHLLSDVYTTVNVPKNGKGQVCPQCSGADIGDFGTCIGGRNDGAACRVDGSTFVADSTGNKDYKLSASCRPFGSPIASLTIRLDPFTSGTASGGRCPNQVKDDPCGGSTCSSTCTGGACMEMVADPTNPGGPQVCKDRKGGISQLCCGNDPTRPCYPTRNGGMIDRTGRGTAPVPDGASPFPASSETVIASVFCEPATGNGTLDNFTTGLPAPGALLQPMSAKWLP